MEKSKIEKLYPESPEEIGMEAFEEWRVEREPSSFVPEEERKEIQSISFHSSEEKQIEIVKQKEEEKKEKIKGKIKELLFLAEDKGLSHALKKAHKEKDAFLLDVFHDILTKNESYLKFFKK